MKRFTVIQESPADYPAPEFVVGIKMKGKPMSERERLTSSKDVANFCRKIFDADSIEWVEEFVLICLNRQNKPITWCKISKGGISGTVADPKVIFPIALLNTASAIIVAHNHPSGSLSPSNPDIELTRKLRDGAKLLDMTLLDHIILTKESYYSFADEGLLP